MPSLRGGTHATQCQVWALPENLAELDAEDRVDALILRFHRIYVAPLLAGRQLQLCVRYGSRDKHVDRVTDILCCQEGDDSSQPYVALNLNMLFFSRPDLTPTVTMRLVHVDSFDPMQAVASIIVPSSAGPLCATSADVSLLSHCGFVALLEVDSIRCVATLAQISCGASCFPPAAWPRRCARATQCPVVVGSSPHNTGNPATIIDGCLPAGASLGFPVGDEVESNQQRQGLISL